MPCVHNKRLLSYLVLLAIVILIVDLWGLYALRNDSLVTRLDRTSINVFDSLGRTQPLKSYPHEMWFEQELAKADFTKGGGKQKIIDVLQWTMNQVKETGVGNPQSAREALEMARHGKGLSCGPMSAVYTNALHALGFKVRPIQLIRSLFNNADTHVTTEVLLDGRWVIFDPTFNVSYEKNGRLIGAKEIKRALLDGTSAQIKPVFYGKVAYPARLQTYYVNWLPLYNNVLVSDQGTPGRLSKLPPMRYWIGPRTHYLSISNVEQGLGGVEFIKQAYFIFVVALPIAWFVLVLLAVLLWLIPRRKLKVSVERTGSRPRDNDSATVEPRIGQLHYEPRVLATGARLDDNLIRE